MEKKYLVVILAALTVALGVGIWACGTTSSSSSNAVDDDTAVIDDDTSPADDDGSPDDDDDNDMSPADDDDDDNDDASPVGGTYTDSNTHLMWEVDNSGGSDWPAALIYCNELSLGGFMDWRVPTIDELRTLISGCGATQTGGTCGVTNGCTASSCLSGSCTGCPVSQGPGPSGCYFPSALHGGCGEPYWSSTSDANDPALWWSVDFSTGAILEKLGTFLNYEARCVRNTP
jgi:hypothetical protein